MIEIKKLALGSAQFGVEYGVANKVGKPSIEMVKETLALARSEGILALDTAIAYGNAESVLGTAGVEGFDVITKLPSCLELAPAEVHGWVIDSIKASSKRLGCRKLNGVLLHRPLELLSNNGHELYKALNKLKELNLSKKIGISVYEPADLEKLIPNYDIDLVQLPLNILDNRWDKWLIELQKKGVEVHVRSAFLQGVLLMPAEQRQHKFKRWNGLFSQLDQWCANNGVSPMTACLAGLMKRQEISKVIVGVDSSLQLQQIVNNVKNLDYLPVPEALKTDDSMLLNPSNWNKL